MESNPEKLDAAKSAENTESSLSMLEGIQSCLSVLGETNFRKAFGKMLFLTSFVSSNWFTSKKLNYKKEVFEKNAAQLNEKVKQIPEDKVCEVPAEIGVPLMEKLTYVTQEQIKNAYINLLSKASSEDTIDQAHPAFPAIIERLSADEARIVEYLKNKIEIPFFNYKSHSTSNGYFTRKKFATGLEYNVNLDFSDRIEAYINNLLTLGILSYIPGTHKMDDLVYNPIKECYKEFEDTLNKEVDMFKNISFGFSFPEDIKQDIEKNKIVRIEKEKGFFDITPFGQLFIKACTS